MKKLRKVGIASVICGLVPMIAAAFTYAFQQTKGISVPAGDEPIGGVTFQVTTNPYRDYTFPLILLAIGFFALGFILTVHRPQKIKVEKMLDI